jgi:hypothetical protein
VAKKRVYSFRLDDSQMEWLEEAAGELGTTKAALLEDSLSLAAHANNAAADNFGSMFKELANRYGEPAVLMTWVTEEEGRAKAHVRIDEKEVADVRAHVTVDAKRGFAHVFLEVDGWSIVKYGSSYISSKMVATLPVMALVALPWPAEGMGTAAIATIGDILHGGARSKELAAL